LIARFEGARRRSTTFSESFFMVVVLLGCVFSFFATADDFVFCLPPLLNREDDITPLLELDCDMASADVVGVDRFLPVNVFSFATITPIYLISPIPNRYRYSFLFKIIC